MEDLAQRLISWIEEQVAEANCRGTVFGLSGGVDSAVVGVLCKRALPKSSLGVIMPCHSSKKEDLDDALEVARRFDIPTVTITLDEAFDALLRVLPNLKQYSEETKRMAEANLKPRLRMCTLYYLANRLGYLVAGTGNRSEIKVGYFTKYGDGGVDILPLANLVKKEVRELARYLGIPPKIIGKVPTAGLWPGQTDEEEMGLSYEELDCFLVSGQATEEIRRKIEAMSRASAHKRTLPHTPSF